MLESFSFSTVTLLVLMLIFGFGIIQIIIKPFLQIQFRKREGVPTYFFPLLGVVHCWIKNKKEKNDVFAYSKESLSIDPNQKYMLTNLSTSLSIILRDPQYIKEFLQNQHLYQKSPFMGYIKVLIGNGLVAAEDETWKRHRRIISGSFHFDFIKDNFGLIRNTTREFLDKLNSEDYKDFQAISKLQEITGEIVGRIFFGENLNSYTLEGKSLCMALAEILTELSMCSQTYTAMLLGPNAIKNPYVPRFRKVMSKVAGFRRLCMKIIKDRKAKPQQSCDLLTSLLATQKTTDLEEQFSDEEIVDEFLTFFVAGMDTTGHLLGMCLYNLTQHPKYLQQLKEERDKIYNKEATITTDGLQKMDVLHSFLKETLRFHTPAPINFARIAMSDHNLVDIPVKKGDLLIVEHLASAFDERNFSEPYKFKPERWRNTENTKIDPYAFIPFSAGPRNCIGQHLAMIEAKIILSEFLERFEFKLKEGYKLKMVIRFLYEPEDDVALNLTPIKRGCA